MKILTRRREEDGGSLKDGPDGSPEGLPSAVFLEGERVFLC
jgi:hypothetical protein